MFNNRSTHIPEIIWHEAEADKFFMRTADDHARVYQAQGGDAAGHWRAIFNDRGLTTGTECDGSAYSSEYHAKQAVNAEYQHTIHLRVTNARKIMTFYTHAPSTSNPNQEFAARVKHAWEHHGLEAMNKLLTEAAEGKA